MGGQLKGHDQQEITCETSPPSRHQRICHHKWHRQWRSIIKQEETWGGQWTTMRRHNQTGRKHGRTMKDNIKQGGNMGGQWTTMRRHNQTWDNMRKAVEK